MWTNTRRIDSGNENVWKYVFESDSAVAEAVLYKYPTFENRTVICCSTQSGCPVGCRFCGAGDNFVRSLSAQEIVSQVKHVLTDHGVDAERVQRMQVMFMSMGEPLLNARELFMAIEDLYKRYPRAALLISTSAPAVNGTYGLLRVLSQRIPTVGLQFSVHESTDEARNKLVPFKAKLSLKEIAHEGVLWAQATGRQPFFNYCAHAGNTSAEDVARLRALFDPAIWQCTVSVICERDEHVSAANARQRDLASNFMEKMLNEGYGVRMFDPAGQEDACGCGQLWSTQKWMREHPEIARPSIGFNLPVIHTPS